LGNERHGTPLPLGRYFNIEKISTCATNSNIFISADLLGSVSSVYEGEKTRGTANLKTATKFIELFPEADRLKVYQLYTKCVVRILGISPGGQVKPCPDTPGQKICVALRGHHVLDVLVDRPNAVWVLTSEPASGPTISNPSGWKYPTRKVTLLKIRSLQDISVTDVTTLPITDDGIIYLDSGRVNVFLIYRVGDGTEYTNAGELYTFNDEPVFDIGARSLFKYKNWGGFSMFVDGQLKYFSYDGYYWVRGDQPDGSSTPAEAHAEFTGKQAAKSVGILPADDTDKIADGITNVVERYITRVSR
jgi:hypothetical protein